MPRWAQSIRFRLSLTYALSVFAIGAAFLAAVYLWQFHRLNQPGTLALQDQTMVLQNPFTGQVVEFRLPVLMEDEVNRAMFEELQKRIYAQSLYDLRQASLVGLGLLSVVAFGSGWLLSGWALRPMGRMAAVARDISGTEELAQRIALQGPDDELKDLADTFDEMLDRLQASFEDQRRFVQEASHELRNPLAIAQANLELALTDPEATADELRRSARIAHESNSRIGQIVDDLLTQARHGVPRVQLALVDLRAMAAEVTGEMQAAAGRRNLTLVAVGEPVVVHGDGAALRRAVTNLVANAVRLAPTHSTVTVAAGRRAYQATISVTDEGPGIAGADQQAVFERFWRGEGSGKGLGLGLNIVRQVAERHGGAVELVSAPGRGSCFTLVLPLPVGPPDPAPASSALAD
jgi:signal transduction histidine kinase